MSKQTRGNKGEEKVIASLNKMKGYFKLINNLTLEKENGSTHQIDHIFINEKGVFVIESKSLYGAIKGDNKDTVWKKYEGKRKVIIHNPIIQNKSHVRIIKSYLGKDIDVISLIVFTLNNAPYFPNENVINLSDLSLFIDEYPNKIKLNNHQIDMINDYLLRKESDASMEEHLDNIKKIKENRKIMQKDITFALENRKCPKCGRKIKEVRVNTFKCEKCDLRGFCKENKSI